MAYQTTNPATGETVATFEEISDVELAKVIDVAQSCYEADWRNRPIAQRAQIVRTAAKLMRERQEQLAGLITLEMGKLIAEARGEVGLSADILDYYADRAEAYLKPRPIPEAPGATVETLPLGVIVCIEPWTFPIISSPASPDPISWSVMC
jgi:succinate-semialdehyde dehydrogenase/glutarate-semialdehyde dehydrogenase